ncbi:MAG: Ig-like domain-containing protein, partial [Lachnospiraceae bacterium]|nr:Ig-like domain-containing protein [Lachnospiraceae bacterium]
MLPKAERNDRGKIVERIALSRRVFKRSRWIILAVLLMLSFMPRSAEAASVKKITLLTGQTKQLKRKKAVWKSKKSSVASVSPDGLVTAIRRGKTTVTARVGKKRYRYRITVEKPVLSKKTLSIGLNKSKTLKVKKTSKAFKIISSD